MNKKYEYFFSIAAIVLLLCMSGYLEGKTARQAYVPLSAVILKNEAQQEGQKKQIGVRKQITSRDIWSGLAAFAVSLASSVGYCFLVSFIVKKQYSNDRSGHQRLSILVSITGGGFGILLTKLWPDSNYKTDCSVLGAIPFPCLLLAVWYGLIPINGYTPQDGGPKDMGPKR